MWAFLVNTITNNYIRFVVNTAARVWDLISKCSSINISNRARDSISEIRGQYAHI